MKIVSYNCRSVKRSWQDVAFLCRNYDIICLQEHWLLPHDLNLLNSVHKDFNAMGYSAVDIVNDILIDRPYGIKAILFKKFFAYSVSVIHSSDPRVTVVKAMT